MKRIEGRLFYDIYECKSEDLARAEAGLILAGARYRVEPAVEVNCEQGIGFDFKDGRPSGQYSLAGLRAILLHCNKFISRAA